MNEMYNGQQDMNRQDEQPWSAVETKQNKTKVIPCRKQVREKRNSVQKKYI